MPIALDFVHEARSWARELVHKEARGPGDYANAMRRVARRAALPFGLLWNLHYRLPKYIRADHYALFGEHYVNEQRRRYNQERAKVTATTVLGKALLGASDSLAGE